jgi:hypothetical protein
MVALSMVASGALMVVRVVIAALSGMAVVAFVKLRSSRLTEMVERVDMTKVLGVPRENAVESRVPRRSLWRS